jgi:ferrous iron transport protein B
MPNYKLPLFKNVAINVIEKQKHLYMAPENNCYFDSFMVLASYGPGKNSTMPKNCNGKN